MNIVLGTIGQVIVDDGTDTFNMETSEENDNEKLFKQTKIKANLEATSVSTKTGIEPSLKEANVFSLYSSFNLIRTYVKFSEPLKRISLGIYFIGIGANGTTTLCQMYTK